MRFIILSLLLFTITSDIFSQDSSNVRKQDSSKTKMPNTFYFTANMDNIYDYYTYAVGSIGLTHNKSFSCFALLRGIQFGAGITFLTWKSKMLVTPVVSVLNGNEQSGSGRRLLGETFSPGIVSTYSDKKIYCDNGLLYYKVIRKKSDYTFDALLYWFTLAYKINSKFYLGVHNESLFQTNVSFGPREFYYVWLGAYTQVNITQSSFFKVIAGYDFKEGDFARASFGFYIK